MNTRKTLASVLVMAATMASSWGYAEEPGWYLGGNFGASTIGLDLSIEDLIVFDDGSINTIDTSDSDSSYKFFLGYQMNENFSVELGFLDVGEVGFTAVSDGSGVLYSPGGVDLAIESSGATAGLNGYLPVADNVNLYGKAGLFLWDVDVTLTDSASSNAINENGSNAYYGVGAEYSFGQVGVSVDYTIYDFDGAEAEVVSAGLRFKF